MNRQIEMPINGNITATSRSLKKKHPNNQNLYQDDKEFLELLREVKIRFDTNPKFYQREDYQKLIELFRKREGESGKVENNTYSDPWYSLGDWSIFDFLEEYNTNRLLCYKTTNFAPIINEYTNQFDSVFDDATQMWILVSKYRFVGIPSRAFYNETSLSEIYFPETVKAIGEEAFYGCTSLLNVNITQSMTSVSDSAFSAVPNIITTYDSTFGARSANGFVENYLVYDSEEKQNLLACFKQLSGEVELDDTVTYIAGSCFFDCTNIDKIVIPTSVNYIGDYCFNKTMLTEIYFEGTCEEFETIEKSDSWRDGSYIDRVVCSDNVIDYNTHTVTFYDLDGNVLSSQIVHDGNSAIEPEHPILENHGFAGWDHDFSCVTSDLSICPNYITKVQIGDLYFNLDEYSLSAEVTKELDYPPYWTNFQWQEIEIPDGIGYYGVLYTVKSIRSWAFQNLEYVTSISIPNSVISIGERAFSGCTSLSSIEIPNSVTSIGESAFSGCSNLTSITIGNSVTSIGGSAFYNCSALTSIEIPNSVTSMGEKVFYQCTALTSATIGNNVTSIEGSAFYGCTALTSVEIPNSVTSIGYAAFQSCSGLISIICESAIPPNSSWSTFNGVDYYNTQIYVPSSSISLYQSAEGWRYFTNIQAIPE